jgi:hypothetical protein
MSLGLGLSGSVQEQGLFQRTNKHLLHVSLHVNVSRSHTAAKSKDIDHELGPRVGRFHIDPRPALPASNSHRELSFHFFRGAIG